MNTRNRLLAAAAILILSQGALAQQGSWECFVLTTQNTIERVTVQAATLEAAKMAAMKSVGSKAYLGVNGQSCNPPTMQAQASGADQAQASGADQIIQQNPQLKSIPDWMTNEIKTFGVTDCDRCAYRANLGDLQARKQQAFRCVDVQGKWGGEAWQSGGGARGHFLLQLYPESPVVWRVFIADSFFFSNGHEKAYLVAEFDPQGKLRSSRSARAQPLALVRSGTPGSTPSTDCPKGGESNQKGIMPTRTSSTPSSTSVEAAPQVNPLARTDGVFGLLKEFAPYAAQFGWNAPLRVQNLPCSKMGEFPREKMATTRENEWIKIPTTHWCREYAGNDGHTWRISFARDRNYDTGGGRIFRIDQDVLVLMVEFAPASKTVLVDNTGVNRAQNRDQAETNSSAPTSPSANAPPTVDPAAELTKALGKLFNKK